MYSKPIFFKKMKKLEGGFFKKAYKILNTKNSQDMRFVVRKSAHYPASTEHKFS